MVQATSFAIYFLLATMVGWVIDSGYRSLRNRTWVNAGYFIGPFCPIYGFGALLLLFMVSTFGDLPFLYRCGLYFVGMASVEFFGGLFSTHVLKVRLWDYSDGMFNILGQVDLLHSFYWLILALLFEGLVWPLIDLINDSAQLLLWVDRVVFVLAALAFGLALVRKMVKERRRVKPFVKEGRPKIMWKHMDRMNDRYENLMERLDEGVFSPSEKATKEWFDEHEYFLDEVGERINELMADVDRMRHKVPMTQLERDLKRASRRIRKRREQLSKLREMEQGSIRGSEEFRAFLKGLDRMKEAFRGNKKRASRILQWRSYISRRGRSFHPLAILDRFPAWQKGWRKRKEDLMTLLRSENG